MTCIDISLDQVPMVESVETRKRKIKRGTKVKTGCATCRVRKIKCDEGKPFCQKCVSTGRTCDGYDIRFKTCPGNTDPSGTRLDVDLPSDYSTLSEITCRDVELLSRCFSTKTMLDVDLDCDDEAKQVLQASLTDPSLQHAISSLRALREDLEMSSHSPASVVQQTPSYYYGLRQYSLALRGLASNLSALSSNGLKSALLCCQVLISIEQVRHNYSAMAQHLIQGLTIMREYRARPGLLTVNELVPANHDQLPFLDVFIIKLFAAPCKFTDPPATVETDGPMLSACPIPPQEQSVQSRTPRTIAPDMRPELTRIATLTLELLGKVSRVASVRHALRLLSEKAALLDSLESWLIHLELSQKESGHLGSELMSISFMRLFHLILKIVLLGALDSSSDSHVGLRVEEGQFQRIADDLNERLKSYRMCSDTGSSRLKNLKIG